MSSLSCGTLYSTHNLHTFYFHIFVVMSGPTSHEAMQDKKHAHDVGASSEGIHPISFRTRQLSLLEPMVLCVTAGESR